MLMMMMIDVNDHVDADDYVDMDDYVDNSNNSVCQF